MTNTLTLDPKVVVAAVPAKRSNVPQLNMKIDLGHILTIGTLLVSIGIGWGSVTAIRERQSDLVTEVRTVIERVTEVREKQREVDARLQRVEAQLDTHIVNENLRRAYTPK